MKKTIYITFASALFLLGCSEDYDLDERGLSVEELPAYVAFDSPGTNTAPLSEDVAEDDGILELNVEVPTGTTSNVTVNYTFSGTAIFGVDFTVEGATSAGGSLVVVPSADPPVVDARPVNADIEVELLADDVTDGDKILIVTLVSASNAKGSLEVGRGGKDILRTTTVTIEDID